MKLSQQSVTRVTRPLITGSGTVRARSTPIYNCFLYLLKRVEGGDYCHIYRQSRSFVDGNHYRYHSR